MIIIRVKYSKAYFQECLVIIEQQEASGLSVVDFCIQQQLDNKYFHTRKRSLLKRQQSKLMSSFIKVSNALPCSTLMSMQLGDAKLTLPFNTESDWLAQFVSWWL